MDEDKILDLLRRIRDFLENDVYDYRGQGIRVDNDRIKGDPCDDLIEEIEEVLNRE